MARHRLVSSKTPKTNLDPSHTSLPRHPPFLLKISTHAYLQRTMKTTSGGSHDEKRTGGGLVDIANMVGPPTTGSLSIRESPNDPTEAIEGHQEEKDFADSISEDGISPDDAPEVVFGDIDEEVRSMTL